MKKNIAIIIQKLNGGGAERTAANLSMLLQEDYNVHLIVFDGSEIKYPYAGIMHDLKMPPTSGITRKIRTMFGRVSAIKKIKKNYDIVASISLMMGANLVNVMSKQGDMLITSVRNQMSQANSKRKLQKIGNVLQMKYIATKSDCVVALSKGVEKDLIDNFSVPKGKTLTIYNPCDGNMLKEKAKIHLSDTEQMSEHSITTMGRFIEQKGQWHLIRALTEVKKSIPDIKLYVLGEGALRERLKKLVEELQLENNVKFLGFVEAPHAYIMKSKVFVFPSLFEGLGNVLLEALACGTPCIASDCFSGPREIIAPDTEIREHMDHIEYAPYGILVSVCGKGQFNAQESLTQEELQLAEAILMLLNDSKMRDRYAEKAIERSKQFEPHVIKEQWEKIIESKQ